MKNKKSFIIGLTGSMGMGKSTTAAMFLDEGIPVWDADATVHQMYEKGGSAVDLIGNLNPDAVEQGFVDRAVLKTWISNDKTALPQIEAIVHPLLAADRATFIAELQTEIAVLDFPLLFESGAEKRVDLTVVVSAPIDIQKARILARKTMTPAMLDTILAKQMPDSQKRAKADVVIKTISLEETRKAVQNLLADIRKGLQNA